MSGTATARRMYFDLKRVWGCEFHFAECSNKIAGHIRAIHYAFEVALVAGHSA